MNVFGDFSNRFKIAATATSIALALVLGELDYVTGREWAISALYLLPTGLAAWVAGRWMGWAVGSTTFLISRATRDALRRPISLRALPRQSVDGVPQPI